MTANENELRAALASQDDEKVVQASFLLCNEILFGSNRYLEAELILLEAIGRQNSGDGYIIQSLLAELYINIGEISRAKRFLDLASTSKNWDVKKKVDELQKKIGNL